MSQERQDATGGVARVPLPVAVQVVRDRSVDGVLHIGPAHGGCGTGSESGADDRPGERLDRISQEFGEEIHKLGDMLDAAQEKRMPSGLERRARTRAAVTADRLSKTIGLEAGGSLRLASRSLRTQRGRVWFV